MDDGTEVLDLRPDPDRAAGGRAAVVRDLVASDWRRGARRRAEERADRYFTHFRMAATATGGLRVRDGHGDPVDVPAGLAGLRQVHVKRPRPAVSAGRRCWPCSAWLAFHDADGTTLLLVPGYGWDGVDDLAPLARATGLTRERAVVDLTMRWVDVDARLPGFSTALFVPVGGAPRRVTRLTRRLDEDLRFA